MAQRSFSQRNGWNTYVSEVPASRHRLRDSSAATGSDQISLSNAAH
jgi:hypothetical protein